MALERKRINGVEINYRDEGAGKPIVFLHAFPLNQCMWDEQVAYFSAHHRVVTFDWRGFGNSELGSDSLTLETFADDLASLLNELTIEQAIICGLSMGGYAAFSFYRKYAPRVAALILADTRPGTDTEEGKKARIEMAALVRQLGPTALLEKLIPRLLGPTTRQTKPEVVARVQKMIAENQTEGIARALLCMAERPDSTRLLSQIESPTLIIAGSEDELTPPAEAEEMRDGIPHASLEVIYQAGHLSNLEQPDAFNKAVANFLERL